MATKKEKKIRPELVESWKKFHDLTAENEEHEYFFNEEAHYESLCIGWCCGQGMSINEAMEFYQQRVAEGNHF